MTCLSPADSFSAFDKRKLIQFAEFYKSDFSPVELAALDFQLENYILDVRSDRQFSEIKGIGELAKKIVRLMWDKTYNLVYFLMRLTLPSPVVTATIERAFSAMKFIKNSLRNRMGDELMNDCLVTYIEKDIFDSIDNESIIRRFQNMAPRRRAL